METKVPGFLGVLGILLLFVCFSSRTAAAFDPKSFQRKLVAMQKVLDYIKDRPEQMNLDVIFGLTLAEANLIAANLHENMQYLDDKSFIAFKDVLDLCALTRKNLTTIISNNDIKFLTLSTLNNPNLWQRPITWRKLFSKLRPRLYPRPSLNYLAVVRSMWYGTPNETESDLCLIKIVDSSLTDAECKIPDNCVEILMNGDGASGYALTHRLLIVQVAEILRCKQTAFSSLIPTYCARIFQDLVNFEAWNFPNVTRDLILEEIVLCGMEGYYEFVDKRYEDIILSWPHSSGCFGIWRFPKNHKINRRSSSTIDFECENHTTGVAAASLAVFIRENIENLI